MMVRGVYRCLVWLHPAPFRLQFAEDMVWIFDETAGTRGAAPLVADACISLSRQWLLRTGLWKWVVAGVAGMVPILIAFGSFLPWDKPLCR
jgi:hypothetical protein